MIFTIATRELRALFLSPLAWTLLALVLFILAWTFLILVEQFISLQPQLLGLTGAGASDLIAAPLLHLAAWIVLLITPLLSMRLISEERRNHSLPLLLSAPLVMHEIVLGKYLGLLAFLGLLIMLIALMPLSLLVGTSLDLGKLAAGLLGLLLLTASFAAAGLYLSTLTSQPAVAAVATLGLLLWLWLLESAAGGDTDNLFVYLSLLHHYNALLRGVCNSADIAYYLLFIVTFLGLAIRRLDNQRLQH